LLRASRRIGCSEVKREVSSPGVEERDTIPLELAAYLSKPPPGVTRIDPRDPEVEPLLREIEAAQPAPVERLWEGKGRHRTSHLAGAHQLSRGWFLHVPWLRQPRATMRPELWAVIGGVAAVALGVGLTLRGRIFMPSSAGRSRSAPWSLPAFVDAPTSAGGSRRATAARACRASSACPIVW
jgi:hypothetical protein